MSVVSGAECGAMHGAALWLMSLKDVGNLVVGFVLLVLLALLVKEMGGSRR